MCAAHVLIASLDRLARRPYAPFTLIDSMDKPFAVLDADHDIVPESQKVSGQPSRTKSRAEILDLRRFPRAIQTGEADEPRFLHFYFCVTPGCPDPGGFDDVPWLRA